MSNVWKISKKEDYQTLLSSFPYPVCSINLDYTLHFANESGLRLFEQLDLNFFKKNFKDLTSIISFYSLIINDHKYIIYSAPITNDNQTQQVLCTFIDAMLLGPVYGREFEKYQTTIKDLQTIFDNSYDVLYVSDGNGKTLRVSSACERLWGKKAEELIGKTVFELEKEGVFNPSATRLAIEQKKKVQVIQSTGTGRRLMVVSTPIRDINGNIVRIVNASRDITEIQELENEIKEMKILIEGYRQQLSKPNNKKYDKLIYRSRSMEEIMDILPKIAHVDSTVLITGESGVGKEVIANYIHQMSYRKNNPFIKINCAAIPESLLESELFGYERGAFTGANKGGKVGLFELANKGTLFLDEIGDMTPNLQAKLLRVLQEGEFFRIGGQSPVKIDVRIISATNKDLQAQVKKDLFREDLYYRLNVIPIYIPPLRKRQEDILPLIQYFLEIFSKKFHQRIAFSQDVITLLENYHWPGNVRELQNIVERLVVTSNASEIHLSNIPKYILKTDPNKNTVLLKGMDSPKRNIEVHDLIPLREAIEEVEKQLLKKAKARYKNISDIANALKVNQSTISRKLSKYFSNKV